MICQPPASKPKGKGKKYRSNRYRAHNRRVKVAPSQEQKVYKGERKMKELLDALFPGEMFQDNARPRWCVNPATGATMELDRYYPELKVAFEFQGDQHYKRSWEFHATHADFTDQVARDKAKRVAAKRQGVFICFVHASDLHSDGMDSLLGQMARSRAAGKWWHGNRRVKEKVRKKASKPYARKIEAAKRAGTTGTSD